MRAPDADRLAVTNHDLGREEFIIGGDTGELQAAVRESVGFVSEGMSEISGMHADAEVGIDMAELMKDKKQVEAELRSIAKMKAEAKAGLDTSRFDAAAAKLLAKKEAIERKMTIPVDVDRGTLNRGATALRSLNKELDTGHSLLGNWFRSLGKVRIQMGFLSGTVRQMGIGFALLGPVLFGVVGSLSALVGVVGTGLTGALTVGGAALTGFGIAIAGLAPSLGDLMAEAKKMESLTGPMKRMKDTLTGDIRGNFFQGAHEAIKTLTTDFPAFRQGATGAFAAATQGWNKWMSGLRSPEARQVLSTILGNLTRSIPSLMQGFGSLGAMMGRVFASASKSLPALNQGFAQWAANLSKSVGSGGALDDKIGRLVSHMQDLGHLSQSAGRVLVNFFNQGAGSGQRLVRSLTGVFNGWNKWMTSVEGRDSLENFFNRSERLARQLVPAIARIGTAMANVAVAFEPLTEGGATALNAIAKAAAAVPPPVLAAAGAMLVLNKAMKFLMVGKGIQLLAGGIGRLAPLVGGLAAAFRVGGLATAMSQAGVAAGALLTPLAGAGAVFGATVIGARYLSDKMDGLSDSTRRANAAWEHENTLVRQLPTTFNAYRSAVHSTKQAQDAYRAALDRTGPKSHQTAQALRTLNAAIRTQNAELASLRARGMASYTQALGDNTRSLTTWHGYLGRTDSLLLSAAQSAAQAAGRTPQFTAALQRNGTTAIGVARSLQQVGLSVKQLGVQNFPMLQQQLNQFNSTQQKAAAGVVNYARSLKGLGPVTGAAAQQVGKFIQQFGRVQGAKRAVIQTNAPQKAAEIAKLSTQLNKVGQKKAVVRILAQGGNAEQIIDKLSKKVDGVNRKRGVAKLSAQDQTGGKIERAKSKLDDFSKKYDATMHVLGADAAASAAQRATSAVESFPTGTRTMNLVTNYIQHGSPPGGGYAGGVFPGSIPGFASGADDSMLKRAHSAASNRQSQDGSKGARIDRPTYITGEESKREYVIATNPAYRRANVQYLMAAAADLGVMMIPGYKKGKPAKKGATAAKKKQKGPTGNPKLSLDDATAPNSDYAHWQHETQIRAEKVSLLTRYLEQGTATVSQVRQSITDEITAYTTLAGIISGITNNPAYTTPVGVPKALGGKAAEKNKAKAKKRDQQRTLAQAHNQGIKSNLKDLQFELRNIRESIIPGLQLDSLQVGQNGAIPTSVQAQAFTAAAQRADAFKTYASNVGIGPFSPIGGGTSLSSPISPGSSGFGSPSSRAATTATAGRSAVAGSTVINNFAAPPPDPHTWAHQQAFELAAL